ncbi:MAG TPA: pyridoxamine 5'-phosphate oxidase [Alphaproteobacteria bacterium]|nr:pyridoxamine 5'-phosphate oxidase [Alphaproteobacteria bacterium]
MSIKTPIEHFTQWYEEAKQSEPSDPDAACLATIDSNGMPNARVILVRKIDDRGFCFFTNLESTKGHELLSSHKAALNFHWKSLKRQVRIRGEISTVSKEEADGYYASRPLGNRIGAWASLQSRPLESRDTLIQRVEEFENKFGDDPPRPDHWGGFRLSPTSIEFWQEGEHRLHNRLQYTLSGEDWNSKVLYP